MRMVIALGGNALGKTPLEQLKLVKETAKSIVDLAIEGHEIVVTHGNGPQVGMINLAMEYANAQNIGTPSVPFAECGAMSEGYIGYHLQQAIKNEFNKRNINKEVVTVVTQVLVDEKDKAFINPTKPIGLFYTKEEAEKIHNEKGYTFVDDAGRGYRRVVASPKPLEIIELKTIETLIKDNVVIAVGGGGIPVVRKNKKLNGISAVIDKDFSSGLLAKEVDADLLLILTAVSKVSINYNKDNQIELDNLNIEEINKYIESEEFSKGSMLPKVEACKEFVEQTGKQAIITSLLNASDAIKGNSGTLIKKS